MLGVNQFSLICYFEHKQYIALIFHCLFWTVFYLKDTTFYFLIDNYGIFLNMSTLDTT